MGIHNLTKKITVLILKPLHIHKGYLPKYKFWTTIVCIFKLLEMKIVLYLEKKQKIQKIIKTKMAILKWRTNFIISVEFY